MRRISRPAVDQGKVERALAVLQEAAAKSEKAQTRGVALALWVLRGHCPDDWLVGFWDAAGVDHDIGRSQSLQAYYNGIVLRVLAPDPLQPH